MAFSWEDSSEAMKYKRRFCNDWRTFQSKRVQLECQYGIMVQNLHMLWLLGPKAILVYSLSPGKGIVTYAQSTKSNIGIYFVFNALRLCQSELPNAPVDNTRNACATSHFQLDGFAARPWQKSAVQPTNPP